MKLFLYFFVEDIINLVKTNPNINFNFRFEGIGTFEDINNEVIRLNSSLEEMDFPFIISKRVYSISIEMLYNVIYHGLKIADDVPKLEFEVLSDGQQIIFTCSNYIKHEEVANLRKVISHLNKTEFADLRKMKAHQIKNGGISERGGAGLGLIDMRMKSENPIQANFKLINNKIDWVTIEVSVDLA